VVWLKAILILPSHSLEDRYNKHIAKAGGYFPPLGILYLASYLRKDGHKVKIIDGTFTSEESMLKQIEEFNPDLIGITTFTFLWDITKNLIKNIKSKFPNIFISIGGPHATSDSDNCFKECEYFDALIYGEGEETLSELTKKLENKESLKDVKGLSFRDNGEVIKNEKRELIKDLDNLPFPARDLIPLKKYVPSAEQYRRKPVTNLMTARGCPYNCLFCPSLGFDKYRRRSPENVMKEIKHLVKDYGVREIYFFDDTFTISKEWVMKFCDLLLNEKLDLIWTVNARANTVNYEVLAKMKEAGCWKLWFGLESGVQKNLDTLNKRITVEQARNAVKICRKLDLEVEASFILGIPGETYKEALQTINFAKEIGVDYAQFFPLTPLPDTPLGNNIDKYGRILISESKYYNETMVVFTPYSMTSEELKKLIPLAYRSFYIRPSCILHHLKKIRSFEDIRRYFRGALTLFSM
jgi:radical SAM superfamily enzyme YgiQ (UPF0313 family)